MPPILPPSSDSRQVILKLWSVRAPHQPLVPVAEAEGSAMAAISRTLLWFRPGRIQLSGCSPATVSLEETLSQAGPSHGCVSLCCAGTLLAQMLEGYGEKQQKNPNKCNTNSAGN